MIQFDDIAFAYSGSEFRLRVPALSIESGETVALIGPSGSGKTTLLHLAAGILLPDEGTIRVDDFEISQAGDAARRNFRISNVGLIFQEFELLEYLSVRENVLLPYRVNRSLKLDREVVASVGSLAAAVGIERALNRYPKRLSQGERQRVAVCRALIARPQVIFADEPTGNLDPRTSRTIVELLLEQARQSEATVVMVTHDHSLLDRFDRVVDLEHLSVEAAGTEADQ